MSTKTARGMMFGRVWTMGWTGEAVEADRALLSEISELRDLQEEEQALNLLIEERLEEVAERSNDSALCRTVQTEVSKFSTEQEALHLRIRQSVESIMDTEARTPYGILEKLRVLFDILDEADRGLLESAISDFKEILAGQRHILN